ncbi:MAG: hypothetical protein ACK4TG_07615, partial [Thermaurantiacus sp.]
AAAAPTTIEIEAAPTPAVEVALKRGTVNARVSLGFQRALLLNLAPAREAGLRMFPIVGKRTFRDPLLPGGQAVVRFNLISADVAGTGRGQMPTVWIDRDIARAPFEGIVSVMGIRADRVVIRQPAAPTGGQTYTLTRRGQGNPQMRWQVGGETIDVVLDLGTPNSVMNARAAAALERAGLVRRSGEVALWQPVPALSLPVERMTPAPGANFNGLPLRRPAARISQERAVELDAKVAEGIEGVDADDEDDTIVVTGQRERQQRRGRRPWMLIGSDVLDSCERIELDRPGARWLLTCRF